MQLLGELYADKKYLEELMSDQGTSNYFNLLPIIIFLAQCDGSQREVVCLQSNPALQTPT